jgi:hypothetical protein
VEFKVVLSLSRKPVASSVFIGKQHYPLTEKLLFLILPEENYLTTRNLDWEGNLFTGTILL